MGEKLPHHGTLARSRGPHQRRLTALLLFGVDVRGLIEQEFRGGDIRRPRGQHERGLAIGSGSIGIRPRREQRPDHRGIRVDGRFGERRGAELIALVRIRARLEETRHDFRVV